jgi:hypothetical protein
MDMPECEVTSCVTGYACFDGRSPPVVRAPGLY